MALIDIVRSGVAIASGQFESMKAEVVWHAWIGEDGEGTDLFADPVTLMALIDPSRKQRATTAGNLVMTFAVLTILDAVTQQSANSGFERVQPIDTRDKIFLPDGSTAPVVDAAGFLDAGTGVGFIGEITLGTVLRGQ